MRPASRPGRSTPCASGSGTPRRLRRCAAARAGADERRDRRAGGRSSPRAPASRSSPPLRQTLGAAVRWGYIARTRRSRQGPTASPRRRGRCAPSPAGDRGDRRGALAALPAAPRLRRRDRASARGVAGARAARHRPPGAACSTSAAPSPAARWSSWAKTAASRRQVPLSRRAPRPPSMQLPARLDTPLLFPAPRAACSTSTTSGAASGRPRSTRPGSGARPDLRPALDLRLRRARRRGGVRARGADHGYVGADDRAPLRDPARRRPGGDHRASTRSTPKARPTPGYG